MDEIVLSYYDSLLHRSDLELLDEGNWLNDRLIGLFYEYFDQELFQVNNNTFLFVNPSTVQYLKLCESLDEAKMCFLEPLGMDSKEVLFFPLNNNQSNVAGGSHWSLVVIIRSTHSLIHFDSTGSNDNEAKKFYNKYKSFFRLEKFFTDNKFPKQTNSSDCGVYLLAATELIAKQFQNKKSNEFDFSEINPQFIRDYRKICKKIIQSLRSKNV